MSVRTSRRAATASIARSRAPYTPCSMSPAREPSLQLAKKWYPDVPIQGDLSGHRGFFSCEKARTLLGWEHTETE
ncbi:hypothetical protein CALCODRAFT_500172 [Calocera cornea HHB12733]|uniref:Uncharacterized protein n=1 Tax=Calocera cornea HHB12733 TaxID=1353952 RepID=A0A165E5S1_9BASI|nr:hypothetical protein CALCODRAFT_500172 [Calocera cornea HHB12733]